METSSVSDGRKKESWWLRSKTDPRWNADGYDYVGGLTMSDDCKNRFTELKQELGEPPADLEWGYIRERIEPS